MKIAILAGGKGSRVAEETDTRPKPMIEIGGKPILWHIMKHYQHYGFTDFVIALGYKSDYITRHLPDHDDSAWTTDLVDTGINTATGGRIKRLAPHVGNETFMLTWGDGVSDVDLDKLLAFHRSHGKRVTVTAVHPPARFGRLTLDDDRVTQFSEKPQHEEGWINGAFFVVEPQVFDYIEGDDTAWEREPLERLASEGQLMAYRHEGFWQCMDTLHDKRLLEEHWNSGTAPWKTWE